MPYTLLQGGRRRRRGRRGLVGLAVLVIAVGGAGYPGELIAYRVPR